MGVLAPVAAALDAVMAADGFQQADLGMDPGIFYFDVTAVAGEAVQQVHGDRIPFSHAVGYQQGNPLYQSLVVQFHQCLNGPPADAIGGCMKRFDVLRPAHKGNERKGVEGPIGLQEEKLLPLRKTPQIFVELRHFLIMPQQIL